MSRGWIAILMVLVTFLRPMVPARAADAPAPAPAVAAATPVDEDHLVRLQSVVLDQIAAQSAREEKLLEHAISVVGVIGTLVLGVFGFFGWRTAKDARETRTQAETILAALAVKKQEMEVLLARLDDSRNEILTAVRDELVTQFVAVVEYGMKMAEITGPSWNTMSPEERLRHCREAQDAVVAARVQNRAKAPMSLVLAHMGLAYLDSNQFIEAIRSLEESLHLDERRKPDRRYNLACAYVKLTGLPDGDTYAGKAMQQLRDCMDLALASGADKTRRAELLAAVRTDPDLQPLRGRTEFTSWVKGLPAA
jgi:hypothetical protein